LPKKDKKKRFKLKDIDVLTVGLVPWGANQEEFFLLKSKDGGGEMPTDELLNELEELEELIEDTDVEEETEPMDQPEDNVIHRLAKAIAQILKQDEKAEIPKEVQQAAQKALDALKGVDHASVKKIKAALQAIAQGKAYGYGYGYGYPAPAKKEDAEIEKSDQEVNMEDKATQTTLATPTAEVPQEVAEKLETLEKANQELLQRLEKAEQEAQAERDARRKQELIEKARTLVAVPAKAEEVADLLFWLEKQGDEGREKAQWLEEQLRAIDHQLLDAGLFKEFGSSETPRELSIVEKAEKIAREEGIDFADALLRLPPEEQAALLEERARRAK